MATVRPWFLVYRRVLFTVEEEDRGDRGPHRRIWSRRPRFLGRDRHDGRTRKWTGVRGSGRRLSTSYDQVSPEDETRETRTKWKVSDPQEAGVPRTT